MSSVRKMHIKSILPLDPLIDVEEDYPCFCLCLGLEQIIITRFRLRIGRHFPQILRIEARIFIFVTLQFAHITFCFLRQRVCFIYDSRSLSDVQKVIQSFEDLLLSLYIIRPLVKS
jgi:hypothetical protein